MDIITVQTIIAMLDRQIDMINGYALHNKGGLTETETTCDLSYWNGKPMVEELS